MVALVTLDQLVPLSPAPRILGTPFVAHEVTFPVAHLSAILDIYSRVAP